MWEINNCVTPQNYTGILPQGGVIRTQLSQVNGNFVQTGTTEVDYPEELKELINERGLLIYKQNIQRFKKGKAKMIEKLRKGEDLAEFYLKQTLETNHITGEVITTEDSEIEDIRDATIDR